jgi:ParB family chromosome partitioning protein
LEIAVGLIDRNPYQTRTNFDEEKLDELAKSIAASGVVQPIVVRKGEGDRFTLITGERRLMASKKAGKETIPAIVREVSNLQAMEMTIVENLQRADLNPMEQAHAYHRLSSEFHVTQEQMAIRTGKDRASVTNFLRLLKLPEAVQKHVESGELSFGHAKCLLALDSPEAMSAVAQKVLALNLSVRATENYVQAVINPERRVKEAKPEPALDPNVREAQDSLRRSLGLKVTIDDRNGKGKVIIEYSGVEDFDAILTALGQSGSRM